MVKNVNVANAAAKRSQALAMAENNLNGIEKIHVSFQNTKMGNIPSFSVLPIITCKNCGECSRHCYACLGCFNYNNVMLAHAENTALVKNDPKRVEKELNDFLSGSVVLYRYFRFNTAGDVFNVDYLNIIINVAKANPWTTFLVFTKNYDLFNEYLDNNEIPSNIKVIFSRWDNATFNNRHDLPVAIVKVDENTEIPEKAFHCTGNCESCLECWKASKGSARYFDIH